MGAKHTIGSRIVIEGEKEYNESLRRIREEHKELNSEMKLCTETYREQANSVEALQKKQEILTKQIDAQGRQVESQRKMLENAGRAQEEAGKKTEQYKNALAAAEKELEKMESSSEASTEAIEAQKKEIQDLNSKLMLSQQEFDKAEAATVKYQTALNNSEADLKKLENELDRTGSYLEEAGESADGCAKSIDNYGRKTKEAGENAENFGARSANAVNALAGALVAAGIEEKVEKIAGVLMECSEAGAKFETSMAKVYTIAKENVVAQEEMSAQILKSSAELKQFTGDMNNAAYNAISAGVDTADAVNFVEKSTKLAVGGFTDASTAVDILTTALNAYGLEVGKTTEISDMLITTQNLGKTTVNELASNMGRVIPLAAAYNVNMANLSATYAKLTANGIKTAESTTYIKAMLNELGDSGSVVSKILQEQTGESFASLMEQGYSLGEVIDILGQSVDGNTGAFNELWSSSEAGIGALSLLGSGVKEFNRVLDAMESSSGATQEAFEKMTDTTEYAQKRMQVAIENLKIAIGSELNPVLKGLYDDGANAFEWATEFVQEHPEVVKAIAVVVGALGTAAVAMGTLTAAVAALNVLLTVASPVTLLLAAAVAAVGGALGALILTQEKEQTQLEKQIEATKEETEVQQERLDAINAELEAMEARIQKQRQLIQSIVQLNAKEDLSVQEKAELADKVAILNEMMPQLNAQIDEQTGKLSESTEAFAENARAMVAIDEGNSSLELRKQYTEELVRVQREYEERQREYNDAAERANELEEQYNKLLEEKAEAYGYTMAESAADVLQLKEKLDEARNSEYTFQTALQDTETQLSQTQETINNLTDCIEANKDATNENNLVQVEYKGIAKEVTVDVASSMWELEGAYKAARDAAEESLKSQVGLFEELSTKSDLSTEEMAANLQSQTEAFNQYKEDLLAASALVEKGLLDEGLLGSLQELGMDGSGYLHELVEASREDAEAYADVVASYQEMIDARAELADAIGDLQVGYTDKLDEMLGLQTQKYGELVTTTEESYAELQKSVEEALAEMVTMQEDGMASMVETVTQAYPEMEDAVAGLCDVAQKGLADSLVVVDDGSSEVFKGLGKKIPESVAQGILEGQDLVREAMQDVINNAVANADLSGIAAEIDRQLGKAFS